MKFFDSLRTTNEWLAELLKECGISQNGFGRMIGSNASLVNRWIKGKEKIPSMVLVQAARRAGLSEEEVSLITDLRECEAFATQLQKEIRPLAELVEVDQNNISNALLSIAERLAFQEVGIDLNERLTLLKRYIGDAKLATYWAHETYRHLEVLVSPVNAILHVQYPVNVFLGVLLDLGRNNLGREEGLQDFRRTVLKDIRKTVKNKKVHRPSGDLARQHAVHMLARHGEDSDQNFIEDVLHSSDLFTKRMAYYGLIISRRDDEIIEQFLYELQHDSNLASASILFDALHYRDVYSHDGRLPSEAADFSHAISNILRHIIMYPENWTVE